MLSRALFEQVSFEILWDGDKIFRLGNKYHKYKYNNDFFGTKRTNAVLKTAVFVVEQ